ncbi:hypothetical protein O181_104009 [Austropuccinia psidii MF-1]|uniref:Uncharacterized protein n=1 Tax=Austropuccinia psidii MF-1 TaxID=1389203 RepID=A0A9Q3JMB6_9BASI|nr:hypothetical protein [Austropuccinia psidii MF-1]
MGFKCQKQNPPNPPQQDSPVPCMPASKLCSNPLQAKVATNEPSRHNEPPIPGLSKASDSQLPSHENNLTREPEPEVASTQSLEEAFACPTPPHSFIIIDNMPIRKHLLHFPLP